MEWIVSLILAFYYYCEAKATARSNTYNRRSHNIRLEIYSLLALSSYTYTVANLRFDADADRIPGRFFVNRFDPQLLCCSKRVHRRCRLV